MGLSKTDIAYAYGVGMLEQAIKSAVSDLEAGRSERALDSLKRTLATWEQKANYFAESTNGAGVPLPTI